MNKKKYERQGERTQQIKIKRENLLDYSTERRMIRLKTDVREER